MEESRRIPLNIDDRLDIRCVGWPVPRGGRFNLDQHDLGNPRSKLTIYHLARMIIQAAKSDSELRFVRWDHPDVELRVPDVKKAEERLGFSAKVDLDVGLARTIAWYREALNAK